MHFPGEQVWTLWTGFYPLTLSPHVTPSVLVQPPTLSQESVTEGGDAEIADEVAADAAAAAAAAARSGQEPLPEVNGSTTPAVRSLGSPEPLLDGRLRSRRTSLDLTSFKVALSVPAEASADEVEEARATAAMLSTHAEQDEEEHVPGGSLTLAAWASFMDDDGRIGDWPALCKWIFFRGVHPSARSEVWKVLIGYLSASDTRAEREATRARCAAEYWAKKRAWMTLPTGSPGVERAQSLLRNVGKVGERSVRGCIWVKGTNPLPPSSLPSPACWRW